MCACVGAVVYFSRWFTRTIAWCGIYASNNWPYIKRKFFRRMQQIVVIYINGSKLDESVVRRAMYSELFRKEKCYVKAATVSTEHDICMVSRSVKNRVEQKSGSTYNDDEALPRKH